MRGPESKYLRVGAELVKRILDPQPTFPIEALPDQTPKLWMQEKMINYNAATYLTTMRSSERQIPEFLNGMYAMPHANPIGLRLVNHGHESAAFDETIHALIQDNLNLDWDKEIQGRYARWAIATAVNALLSDRTRNPNIRSEIFNTFQRLLTYGIAQSAELQSIAPDFTPIRYILDTFRMKDQNFRYLSTRLVLFAYINAPEEILNTVQTFNFLSTLEKNDIQQ